MAASRLRHAAAVRRHVSSATRPRGNGGEEDGTGSGGAGTVRGRGDRARGGDRLRDRAGGGTQGVFAGFAGAGCGAGGGGVSGAPVRTFAALVAARRTCLLYTSPSPRDKRQSRMPSSA